MKRVFLIILILLSVSCSCSKSHKKANNILNDSLDFNNYVNRIKKIDIPYNLDCYQDIACISDSTIPADLIKRFRHKDLIVGRFIDSGKFISIIYAGIGDILYPTLFTFKKDGSVIDSLYLFSIDCGDSPDAWTHANSTLNGNGIITMIDSTGVYLSDSTDVTDSVSVNIQKFRLDQSGKFLKLSKESSNVPYEER
jgi:hypothetical protein